MYSLWESPRCRDSGSGSEGVLQLEDPGQVPLQAVDVVVGEGLVAKCGPVELGRVVKAVRRLEPGVASSGNPARGGTGGGGRLRICALRFPGRRRHRQYRPGVPARPSPLGPKSPSPMGPSQRLFMIPSTSRGSTSPAFP